MGKVIAGSIAAGFLIGIGGCVFLSVGGGPVGAALFATGLFFIVTQNLWLFTGKVGYLPFQSLRLTGEAAVGWLGNFVGTFVAGNLLRLTRVGGIAENARALCQTKAEDGLVSLLILSFFCGVLMFLAVYGFRVAEKGILKALSVFLPVICFILCGFEHCIANMFYFSLAGLWTPRTVLLLLWMTLGNSLGGITAGLVLVRDRSTVPQSK